MDLSTLNSLQQGILFTLLIIGHAIPVFGIVSLIRLWSLRSALKNNSNKRQLELIVPCPPVLVSEQKTNIEEKDDSSRSKAASNSRIISDVREVPADVSTPDEPEGSWNDYGFIVVTEQTHPDQSRRVTSISIIGDKVENSNDNDQVPSLTIKMKSMIRRAADRLACQYSINTNEPGGLEYMALSLTSVLVMVYYIGLLLLGIIVIGFWSKFVRPDIPREDGANPFWAGAFLATSALSNNGMSLIDTNMGPYQKE
jgi:hypothetical protein